MAVKYFEFVGTNFEWDVISSERAVYKTAMIMGTTVTKTGRSYTYTGLDIESATRGLANFLGFDLSKLSLRIAGDFLTRQNLDISSLTSLFPYCAITPVSTTSEAHTSTLVYLNGDLEHSFYFFNSKDSNSFALYDNRNIISVIQTTIHSVYVSPYVNGIVILIGTYPNEIADLNTNATVARCEIVYNRDTGEYGYRLYETHVIKLTDYFVDLINSNTESHPIIYYPINSILNGPESAFSGSTVEVDVSFPDGYKLKDVNQGSGIMVYNDNGYIDYTYDEATNKLRFTMP